MKVLSPFFKNPRSLAVITMTVCLHVSHESNCQVVARESKTDAAVSSSPMHGQSHLTHADENADKHSPVNGDTSVAMKKLNKMTGFMEWYMIYFPVPFGSFSKETSWLFGMSKYNAFRLRKNHVKDTITQPSTISAFGYYTLNTQYKMVLESNIMLNKNKAIWKTDLIYVYYPLLYYGIGNATSLKREKTLNSQNFEFSTFYLFNVWKRFFIGPSVDYLNYYAVDFAHGETSASEDSTRFIRNTGRQAGFGAKISFEGRDNRLNAKRGTFLDAGFMVYNKALGSQYNYSYLQFDIRHYMTPVKNLTIAAQVRTESKSGDVPVQSLSLLGGDYFMRGHYIGRYRDNVILDSQVEMRFPIAWIIGGTAFGGLGQVAHSYKKMQLDGFHYSYGFGLRLKVDPIHNVNLRIDMGFSKDQSIFIMNFAEAF